MAAQVRPESTHPSHPNLIVGIGASAGGIVALEVLLRGLPASTGMAFVVSPIRRAGMRARCRRLAGSPRCRLLGADGDKIAPNHV
jgi:chemotaxis response regulator CheB